MVVIGGLSVPGYDATATDAETLELLAALIRLTKPQTVVEAGTYLGHGAVYMADACRSNGFGHVYTADPFATGQQTQLYIENGLDDWIDQWVGDYLEMLETLDSVDFAFIDASADDDTGARLRLEHFNATLDKLTPGGVIAVHDTAADDWLDGQDGKSVVLIRAFCHLTIYANRGISIYVKPE